MSELLEFYPTPTSLLDTILKDVNWSKVKTVLEPSAGKGDIVSYIESVADSYPHYNRQIDFDCIEIDETLRNTLKGADRRVIADNFLEFKTFKKYDLIIMNPPFSEGDKHLNKALDIQEEYGGDVICILNAETIRNPYTNLRKALVQRLEDANAQIEYMQSAFTSAERQTDVEIAVIKVHYEEPELVSDIFEGLKQRFYAEGSCPEETADLAPNDFVEAIVKSYELEIEAGIKLIREYKAMLPHLKPSFNEETNKYGDPLIELKCGKSDASVNAYIRSVREKYWRALFADKRITGKMTNNLFNEFNNKVNELENYDFSIFNIKQLQLEMSKNLVSGIEDCIISLFDELTHKYSYSDEFSKNIHYYNGWKTNKAWIINKKVILPFYGVWSSWSKEYQPDSYEVSHKLSDIEKALNYLDGGLTDGQSLGWALQMAKKTGQTKNIRLKYFDITFYKKGTIHITFTNEELLKKLNIFGSQRKGWLPPSYGKKRYSEMDAEEKAVIDEFEGEASYADTMNNSDYYLFDANDLPLLETQAA